MENQESSNHFPVEQAVNKNIVEEIKVLNDKLNDSKYEIFSKSTFWHKQLSNNEEFNIESLLKEMSEQLLKIEAKLSKIELSLEKQKND
jgi:hypothetical protein